MERVVLGACMGFIAVFGTVGGEMAAKDLQWLTGLV